MAPTPPEQDHQEPARGRSAMLASTAMPRVGFGLSERAADEKHPGSVGAPSIALTSASVRIEDGLLMAFGPEGDPIPPVTFVAMATEQPDAEVNLAGGETVPAEQVAQVLEAQTKGRLGGRHGDPVGIAAWIETMLGLGPKPVPAAEAELNAEEQACELTVFGRELMLATPGGRAFLMTDADLMTDAEPAATVGLVLADGQAVSVGDLIERLRTEVGKQPHADAELVAVHPFAEVVLSGCAVERSGDALLLELPAVGAVRLASGKDDPPGPRINITLADGRAASLAQVIAALGEHGAGWKGRPGRSDRPAPPPPVRAGVAPSPAVAPRQVPMTLNMPRVEAVDPDRIAIVIIRGVPPGCALSAGIYDGAGRWLVSPRHLDGLTLAPPSDWARNLTVEVTAVAVRNRAGEFATATENLVLALDSGAEGALPLALDPAILQAGGPALSALMIRGMPAGARLSAGTYDAATDGWVLRPDELDGLTINAPAGHADFTLTVMGISLASGGRAEARVLTRLTISQR